MGGARIDVDNVKQVISDQPKTFTYQDIARATKISPTAAQNIIKDMVAEGRVVVDHKMGRSSIYATSTNDPEVGVQNDITHLSPSERFEHIGMLVDMVVQGISPSVLITGVSGIGKTYLVLDRLRQNGLVEDDGYIFIKGSSTPGALYRTLYEHQRQKIVFDDCDELFRKPRSVDILKAALDSYDVRRVCWGSERMPDDLEPQFDFEGQIIFISNLITGRIDEAIKSRTFVVNLQMSRKEICEHLWTIVSVIEPNMDLTEKEMILTELEKRCDSFEQFNVRTFIKACRVFRVAKQCGKNWKDTITSLI